MKTDNFKYQYIPDGFAPNSILSKAGYYISYNDYDRSLYGSDTTAIVIEPELKFLILNGDHRKQLAACDSLKSCVDYFNANIELANEYSEHDLYYKEVII